MSLEEFLAHIENGHIFTITFHKRHKPDEIRTMNCRYGVQSKKKDPEGDLPYNPTSRSLIVVWDFAKSAYRQIPIEGIITVTLDRERYSYSHETKTFTKKDD